MAEDPSTLSLFKYNLNICPSKVFRQKVFWGRINIGNKNKITVFHRIPFLVLYLECSILLFMTGKIVAETLESIVLIHIDITAFSVFAQIEDIAKLSQTVCLLWYLLL